MKNVTILLAVVAVLVWAVPTQAQTRDWKNHSSDNLWTTGANWDKSETWMPDGVPGAGDYVRISGSYGICTLDDAGVAKDITVGYGAGGHLDITGSSAALNVGINGITIGWQWASGGSGTVSISGGSLSLTGPMKVGAGGLPGTGLFKVIGDDAVITLTDDYTQSAVGTLEVDIDSGGISTIAVDGLATFSGKLKVVAPVGGYAGGDGYTLMTFGSSTGDFTSFDVFESDGTTPLTGWSYQITDNDGAGAGTAGSLILVPEPATMVLLGIGGIGVLIRRRRK